MNIRQAILSDAADLAGLFIEMERHYGADNRHLKAEIETRIGSWLDGQAEALVLLAEDEAGALLGHLSAAPIFPSGAGRSAMFVKDIFVRDNARGKGVGEALLRACAAEAKKRGSSRLELTVDGGNPGAARLYERLGARDTGKTYLRWEGDGLSELGEVTSQ